MASCHIFVGIVIFFMAIVIAETGLAKILLKSDARLKGTYDQLHPCVITDLWNICCR